MVVNSIDIKKAAVSVFIFSDFINNSVFNKALIMFYMRLSCTTMSIALLKKQRPALSRSLLGASKFNSTTTTQSN